MTHIKDLFAETVENASKAKFYRTNRDIFLRYFYSNPHLYEALILAGKFEKMEQIIKENSTFKFDEFPTTVKSGVIFSDGKAIIKDDAFENYRKDCFGDKPVSIWKDVSELPEEKGDLLVKEKNGSIQRAYFNGEYIMNITLQFRAPLDSQYCTLTDYINHQTSLESRVERLEKLMEGK